MNIFDNAGIIWNQVCAQQQQALPGMDAGSRQQLNAMPSGAGNVSPLAALLGLGAMNTVPQAAPKEWGHTPDGSQLEWGKRP